MTKKIIENKEYPLNNETLEKVTGGAGPYPYPRKTKNNSICPKCGDKKMTGIYNYVDGMGLELITSCWDCDLHWLSKAFYESEEITYTFVDGDFMTGKGIHVIPKPF